MDLLILFATLLVERGTPREEVRVLAVFRAE